MLLPGPLSSFERHSLFSTPSCLTFFSLFFQYISSRFFFQPSLLLSSQQTDAVNLPLFSLSRIFFSNFYRTPSRRSYRCGSSSSSRRTNSVRYCKHERTSETDRQFTKDYVHVYIFEYIYKRIRTHIRIVENIFYRYSSDRDIFQFIPDAVLRKIRLPIFRHFSTPIKYAIKISTDHNTNGFLPQTQLEKNQDFSNTPTRYYIFYECE